MLLPTSVSRGRYWSAGSEGLQPDPSDAFLADALVVNVPLDRVVGDAADRGELLDHQADHRVMGSVHSFSLAMIYKILPHNRVMENRFPRPYIAHVGFE
jgi:hypothetical protein